jgi:hypothetical protein
VSLISIANVEFQWVTWSIDANYGTGLCGIDSAIGFVASTSLLYMRV